jgi:histone-lysine N-methyltransferase EZH2
LWIVEVISLEAAYRLYTVHSLLYQDIDNTGVLPFKLFSTPGKTGLFTSSRRRYGVPGHFSCSHPNFE